MRLKLGTLTRALGARVSSTSRAICATSSSSLANARSSRALPELDDEASTVEIAFEVEQDRLDPPLVSAVVWVHADRDRRAGGRARSRRRCRRQAREARAGTAEVRRRIAERAATLVAENDRSLELRRSSEQARGRRHVARAEQLSDARGRDASSSRNQRGRRTRAPGAVTDRPRRPGRSGSPRRRRSPSPRFDGGPTRRTPRVRSARARV